MKKQTKQINKIEHLKILLLILVGLLVLLLIFEYSRASLSSRHGEKWKDTRVDCLTSYRCPAEMCVLNLPASAKHSKNMILVNCGFHFVRNVHLANIVHLKY